MLGVKAPIVRVGVNSAGMVIPHNAREVAWLDQGPFPGHTNNAVLAIVLGLGSSSGSTTSRTSAVLRRRIGRQQSTQPGVAVLQKTC